MSQAEARRLLASWDIRAGELRRHLAFLADAVVCYHAGERTRRLVGAAVAPGAEVPLPAHLRQSLRERGLEGHVLLLRSERWLDLWPLCGFGRASAPGPHGRRQASADSPLVYFRAGDNRLLFLPLGVDLAFDDCTEAATVAAFRTLFRLSERVRRQEPDFEEELRRDADALVGRKQELEAAKKAVKETHSGVLGLSGPGGVGKSLLTARLAVDLRGDRHKGLRIAWRFRASDQDRCNRVAFFRHAVLRLADWLGHRDLVPDPEAGKLFGQLRQLLDEAAARPAPSEGGRPPRVLFVLDGLDETARTDPDFAEVPLLLRRPNVVWLCAGRDEGRLPSGFSAEHGVRAVFAAGLPAMSLDDVRAMLLERPRPYYHAPIACLRLPTGKEQSKCWT
jgi:hypothetical protein